MDEDNRVTGEALAAFLIALNAGQRDRQEAALIQPERARASKYERLAKAGFQTYKREVNRYAVIRVREYEIAARLMLAHYLTVNKE